MTEFLASNIIWIIIVAVVLIMAIIGYFAENSELGKKVMGPKFGGNSKPKNSKKQVPVQPALETPAPAAPVTLGEASTNVENSIDGTTLQATNPETIAEVAPVVSDDAWTNNIDTNVEQPTEVVEANPNEWLDGPIELSTETTPAEENTLAPEPTIEGSEDALFTMPGTSDVLPEVSVDSLPTSTIPETEVLDMGENNSFDDIEILTTDDDINPVEQTLANFDSNTNNAVEVQDNSANESVPEMSAEDIWK